MKISDKNFAIIGKVYRFFGEADGDCFWFARNRVDYSLGKLDVRVQCGDLITVLEHQVNWCDETSDYEISVKLLTKNGCGYIVAMMNDVKYMPQFMEIT
jgi:hypothetical protein